MKESPSTLTFKLKKIPILYCLSSFPWIIFPFLSSAHILFSFRMIPASPSAVSMNAPMAAVIFLAHAIPAHRRSLLKLEPAQNQPYDGKSRRPVLMTPLRNASALSLCIFSISLRNARCDNAHHQEQSVRTRSHCARARIKKTQF